MSRQGLLSFRCDLFSVPLAVMQLCLNMPAVMVKGLFRALAHLTHGPPWPLSLFLTSSHQKAIMDTVSLYFHVYPIPY